MSNIPDLNIYCMCTCICIYTFHFLLYIQGNLVNDLNWLNKDIYLRAGVNQYFCEDEETASSHRNAAGASEAERNFQFQQEL